MTHLKPKQVQELPIPRRRRQRWTRPLLSLLALRMSPLKWQSQNRSQPNLPVNLPMKRSQQQSRLRRHINSRLNRLPRLRTLPQMGRHKPSQASALAGRLRSRRQHQSHLGRNRLPFHRKLRTIRQLSLPQTTCHHSQTWTPRNRLSSQPVSWLRMRPWKPTAVPTATATNRV